MLFLARWAISTCAVFAVFLFGKGVAVDSLYTAVMLALSIGLANAAVPHVITSLTISRTIFTIACGLLIFNAFLLFVADSLPTGFSAASIESIVLSALIIGTISLFSTLALNPEFSHAS